MLFLHHIAKGCVVITWRIASELTSQVITAIQQHTDYMVEMKVIKVTLNGESIYPSEVSGLNMDVELASTSRRQNNGFRFIIAAQQY